MHIHSGYLLARVRVDIYLFVYFTSLTLYQ